ncbi:MAG: hypothetical protein JWO60_2083, partial [Frankiales bacterium]|nr:hypothetical protein [Frankiales bacterium]
ARAARRRPGVTALRRAGLDGLDPAVRERWAAGRLWAAHTAPYLATAVLALQPVLVEEHGGVDPEVLRAFPADARWRVHVDPARLAVTSAPVLGFWLLHQAGHLLREHAARATSRTGEAPPRPGAERTPDQQRWGAAADLEVDDDLPGDVVPPDALVPGRVGLPPGRLAEEYHDLLGRAPRLVGAAPDCGSGADGARRLWDGDEGGLSGEDARLVRQETAARVAAQGRERGDVPAGWRRWAEDVLEPVVDWRRELASLVRRGVADVVGRTDHTYRRRSRRDLPGLVLPGMHRPLPRVCVLIDTSASMTPVHLAAALGEVAGVLRSLGVRRTGLQVLCCDTSATAAARVLDARDVRLVGGGGTELAAGIDAVAGLRPRPDVVVVLTDGGTDWPAEPPRSRVVVALLGDEGHPPPWGKTVHVPLDATPDAGS